MSNAPAEIEFLTVEVVLALHQRQLDRFGGGAGLRDRGLLESAVAQPQASFGGEYIHEGLFAMAAASQRAVRKLLDSQCEQYHHVRFDGKSAELNKIVT